MDSDPSTSGKKLSQSSGTEKTPESGSSRTKRAYTRATKSPSLKAFLCFEESMAKFLTHVLTKNDHIGQYDANKVKEFLIVLDTKCKTMETTFESLISRLNEVIVDYEAKRPTELAAESNSVMPETETSAQNKLQLYKGNQTVAEVFLDLNKDISAIYASIGKKIQSSYYVEYSLSMERKLKSLKKTCQSINNELKQIGKVIESRY